MFGEGLQVAVTREGNMRLVIFGANGGTGRALLDQALVAGHEVTAFTRHPEQFGSARDRLTVVEGDVTVPASVAAAVRGTDAVLSALGVPYSRQPVSLYSVSTRHIVQAMQEEGVRRLVAVTSSAVEPTAGSQGSFVMDHVVEPLLTRVLGTTLYADMRQMESQIQSSGLDWTIVRPPALFDAPQVGHYETADTFIRGSYTSRQDLAAFLLQQASHSNYNGKTVYIVSPDASPNLLGIIWRDGLKKK